MGNRRITIEEMEALKPKHSKYGVRQDQAGKAARVYDGVLYDSAAECEWAQLLDILLKGGKIAKIERQVEFNLGVCKYVADFRVTNHDGTVHVEEVKGTITAEARIKLKLFRQSFPDCRLYIVRKVKGVLDVREFAK